AADRRSVRPVPGRLLVRSGIGQPVAVVVALHGQESGPADAEDLLRPDRGSEEAPRAGRLLVDGEVGDRVGVVVGLRGALAVHRIALGADAVAVAVALVRVLDGRAVVDEVGHLVAVAVGGRLRDEIGLARRGSRAVVVRAAGAVLAEAPPAVAELA